MLHEIEDRGQHVTNCGEKIFNNDRDASLCFVIPQRKICVTLHHLLIM